MKDSIYKQEKRALIEEINAAFDGVSRNGGVSLSESWVIDNRGTAEERLEARQQDTETRWQDVPDEDIANGYSCLSFLDGIGFRYYLPAYMTWFLRTIDDQEKAASGWASNTFEFLLYALEGGPYSALEEFYLERFRFFSPEQSKAIAHFLVWEAAQEDEEYRQEILAEAEETASEAGSTPSTELPINSDSGLAQNIARHALEKYWGRFL